MIKENVERVIKEALIPSKTQIKKVGKKAEGEIHTVTGGKSFAEALKTLMENINVEDL